MKAIPTVSKYMTTTPQTIGTEQPITKADQIMREYHIRHLPVLHGGKLVGLISDRDIKLALTFKDSKAESTLVKDFYQEMPWRVSPSSLLNEVALEMAERKYGSVLVEDNNKLVGIFTATDGLRVLAEVLESRFHS